MRGDLLHYCIFKGINSNMLDLYMERCPEKVSPKRRDENIEISGRHGTLTSTDGTYNTYIRQAEFTLLNPAQIDNICAHFKGSGWLTFDDEPTRKYRARVSNQIELSHIIKNFKRFIIEFDVQPFGYDIEPYIVTKTTPFSLTNIGTFESEPIVTVHGTGNITLYINNQSIILKNITDNITINSEMKNVYSGTTLLNNKMSGEFPVLELGENNISWVGNVSKLEIQPNWRWL